MRRFVLASTALMVTVFGLGALASTGVGVPSAGASVDASKAAFCGANDSIDKASVKVDSNAGFLAVLKSHARDLTVMKDNEPSGSLGQEVQQVVSDAEAAVSSNNANALNNLPSGDDIDTYCGVNGNGQPLPSYFGKGKGGTFCATFLPVFQSVSNAQSPAAALAALTADKAQVSQLASELSTLPKSIRAKARATVNKAQTAIDSNNAATLKQNGGGPAPYVALYCGQNQ